MKASLENTISTAVADIAAWESGAGSALVCLHAGVADSRMFTVLQERLLAGYLAPP